MLVPLWLACLSACGGKEVHVERIAPPKERLTCKAQPAPPPGNTDKEVAGFIVDLIEAGQDCRNALAWIKDWSQQP